MVDLTPVSEEAFLTSLQKLREKKMQEQTHKADSPNVCQKCNKKFKSEETFLQHLKSKKH